MPKCKKTKKGDLVNEASVVLGTYNNLHMVNNVYMAILDMT